MDARDIIKGAVSDSGKKITVVSMEMGRSRAFLSSYITKRQVPSVELVAEIADATGHDLLLRNRETGNEIIIDPPSHE